MMTRKECTDYIIEHLELLKSYKPKYKAGSGIEFSKRTEFGKILIDVPFFANKGLQIGHTLSAMIFPVEVDPIIEKFKKEFPTIFRPQVPNSVIFYSKRHFELDTVPSGEIIHPTTRRTFHSSADVDAVIPILNQILKEEILPFIEQINGLGDCYEYINNSPTAGLRQIKYVGNQVYWLAIKALVKAPDFHSNFHEYLQRKEQRKFEKRTGNALPIENELELIEGCYRYLSQVYTNAQQIPEVTYRETHLLPTQQEIISHQIEKRKQSIAELPKAIENFHQKVLLLQEQIALGNNVEKYKQKVEFITNSVIPAKYRELEQDKQELVNLEKELKEIKN